MSNDDLMQEISVVIQKIHESDTATAKPALEALWSRLEHNSDPYQQSIVAHFLADMQSDPKDELTWDLKALDAASIYDPNDSTYHPKSKEVAPFMPSLHLNVGDAYRRNGEIVKARQHAKAGLESLAQPSPDDGYMQTIRTGLIRLLDRTL